MVRATDDKKQHRPANDLPDTETVVPVQDAPVVLLGEDGEVLVQSREDYAEAQQEQDTEGGNDS